MKIARSLSITIAVAAVLGVWSSKGRPQIFPDHRMTEVFSSYLNSLSSGGTPAFVSRCRGSGEGDGAILIIPTGSDTGRLVLFTSHDVYSSALLKIQNGRLVIIEGMGGEWSDRRLRAFLTSLSSSSFRFEYPEQLQKLLNAPSSNICPSVEDRLP